MKYSVVTFGCRVNQADSLGFEEQLRASGGTSTAVEAADVVVVNTCSVTASADQGARQTIRRIARVNPGAQIVVTGCFATRDEAQVTALAANTRVVRNDDKPDLVSIIRRGRPLLEVPAPWHTPDTAARFGDGDGGCGAPIEPGVAGRTAFTLRVQTGCAQPCSYCIIPETRGTPRSVPVLHALDEVRRVRNAGFKEVALTGVHLGSFGRDLDPPSTLLQLLQALDNEFGAKGRGGEPEVLFRISSLEPVDCTPDIVDLVSESVAFAPHFHLPLQHASPRMLAAMRRPYSVEQYASLLESIRRRMPHASIGTDLIVGFPGESDEDFEMLASYLEQSSLTHVHVFPYSDRPGTAASRMGDRPVGAAVKARGARLREIGSRLTRRFLQSQVGTVHRALTLEDGTLAVTGNYLKVRIPPGRARNEWVRLRITSASPALTGEVI